MRDWLDDKETGMKQVVKAGRRWTLFAGLLSMAVIGLGLLFVDTPSAQDAKSQAAGKMQVFTGEINNGVIDWKLQTDGTVNVVSENVNTPLKEVEKEGVLSQQVSEKDLNVWNNDY